MPTLTQLRRWMALPGVKHLIPQKKGWTNAEVIAELQKLAKRLKKTPTKDDIGKHAPFSTIVLTRLFGSVNKAMLAAGLAVNNFIGYTQADCIREMKRVAKLRNTRTLTGREFTEQASFSRITVLTHCGTWNNALRLAGLSVSNFIGYTKDDCIRELKRVRRLLGHSPTISDFEQHAHFCWYVVFRRFGSWNKGLQAAGFSLNKYTGGYTKQDCIAGIRRMAKDIGRTPGLDEYKLHLDEYKLHECPPVRTICKYYGSWGKALLATGLTLRPNKRYQIKRRTR